MNEGCLSQFLSLVRSVDTSSFAALCVLFWLQLFRHQFPCFHKVPFIWMEYGSTLQVLFLNEFCVYCFFFLHLTDLLSFTRCSDHSSVFLQSVTKMPAGQDCNQSAGGKPTASMGTQVGALISRKIIATLLFLIQASSILSFFPHLKNLLRFTSASFNVCDVGLLGFFFLLVGLLLCFLVFFKCRRTNTSVKGWDAVIHGG